MAAIDHIKALDRTLSVSLGWSLDTYLPFKRLTLQMLPCSLPPVSECPILCLTMDEETSGWKAANLLRSEMCGQLRVCTRRDPAHREWNDAMGAIRNAGMLPVIAKSMVFLNVNQAPWLSGAFLRQKSEALVSFLDKVTASDAFFQEHAEMIQFDHGLSGSPDPDELYELFKCTPSFFQTGDVVPHLLV